MNTENTQRTSDQALYTWKGKAPLAKAFPLAFQHVVAMVVGCITMPTLVADAAGLSSADTIIMIQASLFCAALSIFIQSFAPVGIGSNLPVVIGSGFAFLPTLVAVVGEHGMAAMMGAQVIGAVVGILVGIFFQQVRFLFPPLVTASVVITIGISLYPTAINYMAGGNSKVEGFGSYQNWLVAMVTLAAVIFFGQFCKGILKMTSTLLGILVGYLLALGLGMVRFDAMTVDRWFQPPSFLHFGLEFKAEAILALGIMFVVNAVQDIGQMEATSSGACGRPATVKEISGGVIGNGLGNLVGGFLGATPCTTCGQNIGIVVTTRVINRRIFALTGGIVGVAALFPHLAAILATIPQPVLGGATISVFASIAMTGVRMLVDAGLTSRNVFIAGLSIAAAIGIGQVQGEFAAFPALFRSIFDQSPIVIVTILAIVLNLVIPQEKPNLTEKGTPS